MSPESSVLVSHAFGNQVVRALIEPMAQEGRLHSFWTSLSVSKKIASSILLPESWQEDLRHRCYPVPDSLIHGRMFRAVLRQISLRYGWSRWVRQEEGWASVDAICRDIDRWVARNLTTLKKPPGVVYCYEDVAERTFQVAGEMGIKRFYDLPIGHYASAQRILKEEAELMPEFASSMEAINDSPAKLRRKDEELQQADKILACSDFVRQTLEEGGISPSKIQVVQYGAPTTVTACPKKSLHRERPLKVLFVGSIGQRKGIGYLLRAIEKLRRPDVELTLLGRMLGDPSVYARYSDLFHHEPFRPYHEGLILMQQADVLVLPTLFEGHAMVVLEAMMCGLPVITTVNSGTAHLIEDGHEGFVIPIRSVETLAEKIAWMADHREEVIEMGKAARLRAEKCTWESYYRTVAAVLDQA